MFLNKYTLSPTTKGEMIIIKQRFATVLICIVCAFGSKYYRDQETYSKTTEANNGFQSFDTVSLSRCHSSSKANSTVFKTKTEMT